MLIFVCINLIRYINQIVLTNRLRIWLPYVRPSGYWVTCLWQYTKETTFNHCHHALYTAYCIRTNTWYFIISQLTNLHLANLQLTNLQLTNLQLTNLQLTNLQLTNLQSLNKTFETCGRDFRCHYLPRPILAWNKQAADTGRCGNILVYIYIYIYIYSPIHAERIRLAHLMIRTSHIGARKCADHESHLIILKTSAPWF